LIDILELRLQVFSLLSAGNEWNASMRFMLMQATIQQLVETGAVTPFDHFSEFWIIGAGFWEAQTA